MRRCEASGSLMILKRQKILLKFEAMVACREATDNNTLLLNAVIHQLYSVCKSLSRVTESNEFVYQRL